MHLSRKPIEGGSRLGWGGVVSARTAYTFALPLSRLSRPSQATFRWLATTW